MAASFAGSTCTRTARFCSPPMSTCATPADLRDLLRQHVVGVVVDVDQRQRVGLHRQDHDRRVGRIDLPVGRRRRQVLRQLPAGGVDRRLDVAGGAIDVAVEVELHGDLRRRPSTLTEVICATPGICANWLSSGCATVAAMVSGLAPGSLPFTTMVGKSTRGSGATGSSG